MSATSPSPAIAYSVPARGDPVPYRPGASAVSFDWLLRLRWAGLAMQLAVLALAEGVLHLDLPLEPLLALVGAGVATNLLGWIWKRRAAEVPQAAVGHLMVVDVLLFTGMLHLTGGAYNPFSILYLVHVVLATVVMRPLWTWGLVILSLVAYASLFFIRPYPLMLRDGRPFGHDLQEHLHGMWVAFLTAAFFLVWFVQRLRRALQSREAELEAAQRLTTRNERLAALATLSAGAAHELSTPLSTIAIASKELLHHLGDGPEEAEAAEDARLIREQVDRCRAILDRMATEAGNDGVELAVEVTLSRLFEEACRGLDCQRVTFELAEPRGHVRVPVLSASQALRGVLENALQATAAGGAVRVTAAREEDRWRIDVVDDGPGMPPEVAARACEPFFTTKGPGAGMGLGLFLTRAVVERLGGTVEIESTPSAGSRVTLRLPCHEDD